jgi:hypothetical protein
MSPLGDGYAPSPRDEEIAVRGIAGDSGALAELVRRHQRWIYNIALRVPDTRALVQEVKLSCLMGMLLCFDREQRLVFVLGDIFEVSDAVASEVLAIGKDAFRQKLARARRQLASFLREQCGLVNPANPCRCARKTRGFVRDGIVDPKRLVFYQPHVTRVREVCVARNEAFDDLVDRAHASLFREQPFYEGPDLVARLRPFVDGDALGATFELSPAGGSR